MKVAFLDRDGVINKEINYLHKINDFQYADNAVKGMRRLQDLGYKIIIVTNQAGIAKGIFSEVDYHDLTKWYLSDLKNKGIDIIDVFYCPHHPNGEVDGYAVSCQCRKPCPGMILDAIKKYRIDAKCSLVIGDKLSDVEAGKRAGLSLLYLVRTGHILPDSIPEQIVVSNNILDVTKKLRHRTSL